MTWLVFHNTEGRWWARFLKPGFQHVSILMLTGGCWVLIRPMYARTLIEALPYADGDLPHTIHPEAIFVPVEVFHMERLRSLVGLHTCVGVIKSILGVRWPFVITPYQLYKRCTSGYAVQNHSGCAYSGSDRQS